MPLNFDAVGVQSEPVLREWTSKDTLLYALGVGAGHDPELDELAFTTENSSGVTQKALPTFAVLAASGARSLQSLGDFDPAMLVHAEQSFQLHGELPVAGVATVTTAVTAIEDKGSGALVTRKAEAVVDGVVLVTATASMFIRGEGGFGGSGKKAVTWVKPERAADAKVTYQTRSDQALLYRLSGDRNPLHSDPVFAARAGFSRPILHGLCTYGFTGRALVHEVCGSDPARVEYMAGRFSHPVYPGQSLTVSMWNEGTQTLFQTALPDGVVVIDRGVLRTR